MERLRAEKATARTLAKEFKVHVVTIYRALNRMVEEGLLAKNGHTFYVP